MSIPEKLRQAYHNDLTDVPLLLDAAEEIDRLTQALEQIERYSTEGHVQRRARAALNPQGKVSA